MLNSLPATLARTVQPTLKAWIIVAAALIFASPAHALICGQVVTGTVTLTADLVCQNTTGLIVQSNDVTINLNGHSIRCLSALGYEGSCQAPNVGQAIAFVNETGTAAGFTAAGPGLFGADVLLAAVYGVYMYTVLQMRLTREFNQVVPTLPHLVRRLLGVYHLEG